MGAEIGHKTSGEENTRTWLHCESEARYIGSNTRQMDFLNVKMELFMMKRIHKMIKTKIIFLSSLERDYHHQPRIPKP